MTIELRNRQREVPYHVGSILALALAARPACLASVRSDRAPLGRLRLVEVTIVSDAVIGRVHRQFFFDPEPTDVITFDHGEILLGAGVIARNAHSFGQSPDDEAALCVIHGLLHLAGWEDRSEDEERAMALQQEQVFNLARRMLEFRK